MLNADAGAPPADVLVLPMTEDLSFAISLATALRKSGVRAQLYGEQKKFKQKLAYASKLHIPFAAFLGEDEINAGTVTVKDLNMADDYSPAELDAFAADGIYKQITLPTEEAVAYLRRRMDRVALAPPVRDTGIER